MTLNLSFAIEPTYLYAQAAPYANGNWLIVPTHEPNGRYSFRAFDPEGQVLFDSDQPCSTYRSAEAAVAVGKAFVSLILAELAGEAG